MWTWANESPPAHAEPRAKRGNGRSTSGPPNSHRRDRIPSPPEAKPKKAGDGPSGRRPQTNTGEGSMNDWKFIGNAEAVTSLQHATASGHLAHAYLFTGPAGVGKTTLARRLVQSLMCEHADVDARPCLECRSCRQVEADNAPDVEHI